MCSGALLATIGDASIYQSKDKSIVTTADGSTLYTDIIVQRQGLYVRCSSPSVRLSQYGVVKLGGPGMPFAGTRNTKVTPQATHLYVGYIVPADRDSPSGVCVSNIHTSGRFALVTGVAPTIFTLVTVLPTSSASDKSKLNRVLTACMNLTTPLVTTPPRRSSRPSTKVQTPDANKSTAANKPPSCGAIQTVNVAEDSSSESGPSIRFIMSTPVCQMPTRRILEPILTSPPMLPPIFRLMRVGDSTTVAPLRRGRKTQPARSPCGQKPTSCRRPPRNPTRLVHIMPVHIFPRTCESICLTCTVDGVDREAREGREAREAREGRDFEGREADGREAEGRNSGRF